MFVKDGSGTGFSATIPPILRSPLVLVQHLSTTSDSRSTATTHPENSGVIYAVPTAANFPFQGWGLSMLKSWLKGSTANSLNVFPNLSAGQLNPQLELTL